jgi:hypothetical protein
LLTSRSSREKRVKLRGKSSAAFGTTTAQYGATIFSGHPGAKTMGSFSF